MNKKNASKFVLAGTQRIPIRLTVYICIGKQSTITYKCIVRVLLLHCKNFWHSTCNMKVESDLNGSDADGAVPVSGNPR